MLKATRGDPGFQISRTPPAMGSPYDASGSRQERHAHAAAVVQRNIEHLLATSLSDPDVESRRSSGGGVGSVGDGSEPRCLPRTTRGDGDGIACFESRPPGEEMSLPSCKESSGWRASFAGGESGQRAPAYGYGTGEYSPPPATPSRASSTSRLLPSVRVLRRDGLERGPRADAADSLFSLCRAVSTACWTSFVAAAGDRPETSRRALPYPSAPERFLRTAGRRRRRG